MSPNAVVEPQPPDAAPAEEVPPRGHSRRDFLRRAGLAAPLVVGAALAQTPLVRATPDHPRGSGSGLRPLPLAVDVGPDSSPLLRMQKELLRALTKPVEQRRWIMVIDLRKCVGCSSCTVSCIAENHLPPGVVYRPVIEEEIGTFPNVTRRFLPRPCMQCDEPPCVDVCPVSATYKRPDGIVEIDYKTCIGCRYCIAACPYGARTFDFGDYYTDGTPVRMVYESSPSPEYGQSWPRAEGESPIDNVRKCQFCLHRLEAGMLPACTSTCIGLATYFGDANDPGSLVNELVAKPNVMLLKAELGTKPKVYYLT